MEDLINLAIYLIVGLFWLFSVLFGSKRKKPQRPQIPFPFPLPQPFPQEEEKPEQEPVLVEPVAVEIEAPEIKPPTVTKKIPIAERIYEEEYGFDISGALLEEGIILSTILSPPKAYKYLRKQL